MKLEKYVYQHYSETSAKTYLNCIKNYQLAMSGRAVKANYTDIVEYIGGLRKQGLNPRTLVATYISKTKLIEPS